jgi:predicted nucleic acid-binding protein
MKTAVIDTGVFVSGVFWRHEPHLCLKAWLHGILLPMMSEEIFAEYEAILERVKQEQQAHIELGQKYFYRRPAATGASTAGERR